MTLLNLSWWSFAVAVLIVATFAVKAAAFLLTYIVIRGCVASALTMYALRRLWPFMESL